MGELISNGMRTIVRSSVEFSKGARGATDVAVPSASVLSLDNYFGSLKVRSVSM